MERTSSTAVLHRSNVMSKFGSASAGISHVRIGVKPKQCRRGANAMIRAAHCEHASPLRASSSSSSLYDVLSVSPNVSDREIKSAYRRMALRYHPDVCPSSEKEECTTKFLRIQEAYHTLFDTSLRQDYDWSLQNRMELGENEGIFDNSHNNNLWEAQIMELIRRRSSDVKNSSSWGSTMRSRNQQMDTAGASFR